MAKKDEEEQAPPEEPMSKTKTITVKSALGGSDTDGYPVALWEQDDMHPGGEVFIADAKEHEVGETPAVNRAIAEGKLVKV